MAGAPLVPARPRAVPWPTASGRSGRTSCTQRTAPSSRAHTGRNGRKTAAGGGTLLHTWADAPPPPAGQLANWRRASRRYGPGTERRASETAIHRPDTDETGSNRDSAAGIALTTAAHVVIMRRCCHSQMLEQRDVALYDGCHILTDSSGASEFDDLLQISQCGDILREVLPRADLNRG